MDTVMRRKKNRGFTLLEVMIALAILGFGILAAAASQLSAMKFTRDSQLRTEAHYLASQQMETFQTMTGAEVTAAKALGTYPNDTGNPIDPDPNDAVPRAYTRSWAITEDTPESGLFTIQVTVQLSKRPIKYDCVPLEMPSLVLLCRPLASHVLLHRSSGRCPSFRQLKKVTMPYRRKRTYHFSI